MRMLKRSLCNLWDHDPSCLWWVCQHGWLAWVNLNLDVFLPTVERMIFHCLYLGVVFMSSMIYFFFFCRRSKSKTQLVDGVWALGLWWFGVLFFDDISSPTKRRWHVFIRLSTYSSPEVGKNKIFISVAHAQALFNIIRHLVV